MGSLPSSMPSLITTFVISNCPNITGPIPSGIFDSYSSMSSVRFEVSNCGLTGPIPAGLFSTLQRTLTSLSFEVPGNRLLGPLPSNLFDNMATGRFTLDLSSNEISGTIPNNFLPEMGRAASQSNLLINMASNRLEGSIPPSMFSHIVNVSTLDLNLAHNRLIGPLPDRLFPSTFQVLPGLDSALILTMTNNSIYGTIPPTLLSSAFVNGRTEIFARINLDFSYNQLHGGIPPTLLHNSVSGLAASTISLNVRNNLLNDSFPAGVFGRALRPNGRGVLTLDVSFNQLSGSLAPALLDEFPIENITLIIRAAQNKISGRLIPFCSATTRIELDLQFNLLEGNIPNEWNKTCGLFSVNLDFNPSLGGTLPSGIFSRLSGPFSAAGTALLGSMPPITFPFNSINLNQTKLDFCAALPSSTSMIQQMSCSLQCTSAAQCPEKYPGCNIACPPNPPTLQWSIQSVAF